MEVTRKKYLCLNGLDLLQTSFAWLQSKRAHGKRCVGLTFENWRVPDSVKRAKFEIIFNHTFRQVGAASCRTNVFIRHFCVRDPGHGFRGIGACQSVIQPESVNSTVVLRWMSKVVYGLNKTVTWILLDLSMDSAPR